MSKTVTLYLRPKGTEWVIAGRRTRVNSPEFTPES